MGLISRMIIKGIWGGIRGGRGDEEGMKVKVRKCREVGKENLRVGQQSRA